jgi:ABC-2 type transport system permease protein
MLKGVVYMGKFKKYITLIRTSTQQTVAYRSNFYISIASTVLLFISSFFLWKSVYIGKSTVAIYTWDNMKGYLLVAFMCNTLLSWYSESGISRKILDGSVAMDLIKPYNFYFARLSETIGSSVFEALVIAISSVFLIIGLRIPLPADFITWICFFLSVFLALIIKFGIVYLFSMFVFATTSAMGIQWARAAITNLLSGGLVPLVFFPEWCQEIFRNMPFQYIVSFPASIFLNQINIQQIGVSFLKELIWIVILFLLGKGLFSICIRKVTIYGG